MKDLLNKSQPLWLPQGSVRSLIAFIAIGGYLAGQMSETILGVVIAFYFADRSTTI